MFDVGFTEILLIGVVALVVIGPERLPAVAKTAGQWIAKLQRFVRGVKSDLASELQSGDLKKLIGDQREQINELKQMVSSAKRDFEDNTREVVQGAKKSLGELESSVKELDGVSAGQVETSVASAKAVSLESGSDTQHAKPVMRVNDADSSSATDQAGSSSSLGANASTVPLAESVNVIPPSTNVGHETPTMRTDSSASLDESVDRNRTGSESGS